VILTLWMVSSRPSASILPGAPAFGAWWGTPESRIIAKKADSARRRGDLRAAEADYKEGYDDAVRRRDEHAIIGYLNGMAACRLSQQRYRAALESLLEAKDHARKVHDRAALGAIAVNLSTLYLQVWDFESSRKEAEEGRAAVETLGRPYYLPNLLLQLGRLHEIQGDGQSVSFYRQGIRAARNFADHPAEALGLDLLGAELLQRGKLDQAQEAILQGMHLRESFAPTELSFSWWRMGALQLARGNLNEAERYTELALHGERRAPQYLLMHQRGEIRLASGDLAGALADFREAVDLSSHWRLEVLPASSSLTATNEKLEQKVFDSFVELAAREALRTGDPILAGEAFLALELNRASSLRESLALAEAWHQKAPPEYWETLGKLREVESKVLKKGPVSDESSRLRLELAEMEAKAGLGFPAKNYESFRDQTSLIHFQRGLGRSEVLLSFHLGEKESYLWAVTQQTLRLRKIAAEGEIRTLVSKVQGAVSAGRPEAAELGERLYRELFGQLGREEEKKPSWLLSLDGTLFDAPFAALVTERKGGKGSYLVSKHSVQTIPGALLLSKRPDAGTGLFLGVGDPIYNAADPRWREQKSAKLLNIFASWTAGASGSENSQFGRLVGSSEEVRTSAESWTGSASVSAPMLLMGGAARRDGFVRQLGNGPSVIHLATHVVPCGTQSCIAFGLGPKGESEFLTTTDVASLRVPGAFVAMTGCDSSSGVALAGAGRLGLTRAWEMAGASAVLATSWPVRDSSGDILASFYRRLQHVTPAEALRQSQVEMLQSGNWRAEPSYWASYLITGGGR
jgi:CHAT domain-containing protein